MSLIDRHVSARHDLLYTLKRYSTPTPGLSTLKRPPHSTPTPGLSTLKRPPHSHVTEGLAGKVLGLNAASGTRVAVGEVPLGNLIALELETTTSAKLAQMRRAALFIQAVVTVL